MPSSWITKSDATEIRLAHPVNRAGMAAGDRERSYDLLNDARFQDADKTKGKRAIERTTRDEGLYLVVIDDDEQIIAAAGPPDFVKEVEQKIKSGQGHLGGQKDWITNIVAAGLEGRVYPGLDHGG